MINLFHGYSLSIYIKMILHHHYHQQSLLSSSSNHRTSVLCTVHQAIETSNYECRSAGNLGVTTVIVCPKHSATFASSKGPTLTKCFSIAIAKLIIYVLDVETDKMMCTVQVYSLVQTSRLTDRLQMVLIRCFPFELRKLGQFFQKI